VIPVGTLVQIRKDALGDGANGFVNEMMTTENGWLWIVEYVVEEQIHKGMGQVRPMYECRALATGHIATWFNYEIETKEQSNG